MIAKRALNVWRAVVGSGLTELEADHAEAMLDLERLELHKRVQEYNRGLAGYAGLCEKLKTEIGKLDRERGRAQELVESRLAAGDRAAAGRHALRLENLVAQHGELTTQLAQSEASYKALVRQREVALHAARERIESLKRSIDDFKLQRALAELSEWSAGLSGVVGASDGTLLRIKERVEDRCNYEKGRVRVAREGLDTEEARERAANQAEAAEAALRRFESTESA